MIEYYDLLIINNCPSFYKINLYNRLSETLRVHVIFIGLSDQVVISHSFIDDINFSFDLINDFQIESRSKIYTFCRLLNILSKIRARKIVYGGYVEIENVLLSFLIKRHRNCLQSESSIKESKVTGLYGFVKKLVFSRFSSVLSSGKLQSDVFRALNFKGNILETAGVGIFNKSSKNVGNYHNSFTDFKYLYVGRLISLKNLELLVRVFNANKKSLTIVGDGPLYSKLQLLANPNITFTGFIPNSELAAIYESHDVFILPSLSEPWGLVVEEAVYFGLPVIVSENVGCNFDMVVKPNTGVIFNPTMDTCLENAISLMEQNYNQYKINCFNFDFLKQDLVQVNAYKQMLSL